MKFVEDIFTGFQGKIRFFKIAMSGQDSGVRGLPFG